MTIVNQTIWLVCVSEVLVYYQKALIIVLLPLKKVGTMLPTTYTYRFLTAFMVVINIIINSKYYILAV